MVPLLTLCSGVWKADFTLEYAMKTQMFQSTESASLVTHPPSAHPSRASTPVSIVQPSGTIPSCSSTPASGTQPLRTSIACGVVSPSHSSAPSSVAPSCAPAPSPHCISFKSIRAPPPRALSELAQAPQQPQQVTKATAPKGKHRHDPSPPSQIAKKSKRAASTGSNAGAFAFSSSRMYSTDLQVLLLVPTFSRLSSLAQQPSQCVFFFFFTNFFT